MNVLKFRDQREIQRSS